MSWLSKQLEQGGWREVGREAGLLAGKPKEIADNMSAFFNHLAGKSDTGNNPLQQGQNALMFVLIGVAVFAFFGKR